MPTGLPPFDTRRTKWVLESFQITQSYVAGGIPFTSKALKVIYDGQVLNPVAVGNITGVFFGSGALQGYAGTFSGQVFHVKLYKQIVGSGSLGIFSSGLIGEVEDGSRIASSGIFKALLIGH